MAVGSEASGEGPGKASGAEAESSSSQDLVLKVLGAVGTGIGILGFVTFFGGAILWIRAEEANLPANDVVSVIPHSVLVTTGASFLVPAVLIAGVVVALIFLVHLGFRSVRSFHERDKFQQAHRLSLEAETLGRDADAAEQLAKAARALAVSLADAAELAKKTLPEGNEVRVQQEDTAAKQQRAADDKEADALAARSDAGEKKAEADNLQAASEAALERTRGQFYFELALGGVLLAILPPWLNGAICHLRFWPVVFLVLVAAATVVVSLVTYVTTDKFVWFGVVAFVTVGIYIGFATYYSTTRNPKVEPAAALRTGHAPVVGIFIADTASNLYLGSFSYEGKAARLLVVPRTGDRPRDWAACRPRCRTETRHRTSTGSLSPEDRNPQDRYRTPHGETCLRQGSARNVGFGGQVTKDRSMS